MRGRPGGDARQGGPRQDDAGLTGLEGATQRPELDAPREALGDALGHGPDQDGGEVPEHKKSVGTKIGAHAWTPEK
jgi:hypothetical protein